MSPLPPMTTIFMAVSSLARPLVSLEYRHRDVRPRISTTSSFPLLLAWGAASAVGGRARGPESPGGPPREPHIRKTVSPPNQTSRPDDSGLVAGSHSCARLLISVPPWCLKASWPPTTRPLRRTDVPAGSGAAILVDTRLRIREATTTVSSLQDHIRRCLPRSPCRERTG